jgi:hypothetical protein
MKESSKIVSIYPDPLILIKQRNSNFYESQLNLTNLTNEYVIFKLYNNQQILYSAKPSTSFIRPKETTNVLIKRFSTDESQSSSGKDKFFIKLYNINKIINDNNEAKEAFKSKIYNENSKQESMIFIVLKEQDQENEKFITPEISYNEDQLEKIGDDYENGIKIYDNLNEKLRNESNLINQKIKELENRIGSIKNHQELKNEKDRAILNTKDKNKNNPSFNKQIIIVTLFLLGLILGANIANFSNYILDNDSPQLKINN